MRDCGQQNCSKESARYEILKKKKRTVQLYQQNLIDYVVIIIVPMEYERLRGQNNYAKWDLKDFEANIIMPIKSERLCGHNNCTNEI